MLEYVFFHTTTLEMFLDYLEQQDVRHEVDIQEGTMKVFIPDDIDDELEKHLGAEYYRLLDMNQEHTDDPDSETGAFHTVSIDITLKDGTKSKAFFEPEIMNRLMKVLSHEEFGELVKIITDAVENPDDRPYSERVTDKE